MTEVQYYQVTLGTRDFSRYSPWLIPLKAKYKYKSRVVLNTKTSLAIM